MCPCERMVSPDPGTPLCPLSRLASGADKRASCFSLHRGPNAVRVLRLEGIWEFAEFILKDVCAPSLPHAAAVI